MATETLAPISTDEPCPRASGARWLVPGVLCAVTLLFFWSYFLLDQTLYAGDTAFVFVPFRQFLTDHLALGKLPLWNPTLFGGTPALAESQYQVFYPINFLMLLLGSARGMGWMLAFHLTWMGAGTFLFLRYSVGMGRLAALFGAVSFAFGASVQMRLGIPVYTNAAAWIPWILWGYDRARTHGGAWFALAPVALGLQLCTGAAQYSYYTLALLLGYHLFCLRQQRAAKPGTTARAWTALAFTLGASVALAMAQLLPEAELALLSDRGTNASFQFAIDGSLSPVHLFFVTFFPKFYGLYTSAPLGNFVASSETAYLGVATLALLGAASAIPQRAHLKFWTAGALLSIFMALGANNPFYPLMFRFLPGTATFRGSGNWFLIAAFCCAALAALGLQAIFDGNRAARARAFGWSVAITLIALTILLLPIGATAFLAPQTPYGPWGQIALFFVVAALLALAWQTPRALAATLTPRRIGAALLLVLVLDLFAVSRDMELTQTILASDLDAPPPSVVALRAVNTGVPSPRFWSENAAMPLEAWQRGEVLDPLETEAFRARQGLALRSLMPSCVAAQYGAPGLTGAWGALMPLRRHPQPIYQAQTPLELKLRWLRLLNVGNHLSFGPPLQSDWPVVSSEPPAIYRDAAALPRAFWVGGVVAARPENALQTVSAPTFDARRAVVLETDAASATAPSGASELRAANFTRYDETRVDMTINAPASGYLVMMDTIYPGWRARVDGREVPIVPANFVGRGIAVESGTHQIEMWFEPQSVRLGVFVSLLTLGLLAGVVGANWRRADV